MLRQAPAGFFRGYGGADPARPHLFAILLFSRYRFQGVRRMPGALKVLREKCSGSCTAAKSAPARFARTGALCIFSKHQSVRYSRISASTARTSSWKARADTRSAPLPRMISCSAPSELTTRVRYYLAISWVAFSMYMSAVSASLV